MQQFIGRKSELSQLESLIYKPISSMAVIRGRRRIGKSRLVEEFAKNKSFIPFAGLAPGDLQPKSELQTFANQLALNFNLPPLSFANWQDALLHLSHNIKLIKSDKPIVILFDEVSWFGMDPLFIPILKFWWDKINSVTENHPKIILILCGSVST